MLTKTIMTITPTTNININVKITTTTVSELVKYEDKLKFELLCKAGCPNYDNKWACPPYSPAYTNYSKNYSHAIILLFSCDLQQFYYTKTQYMRVKTANMILKTKMDKLMRNFETLFNGKILSNGSCRLCKPCSCKQKIKGCNRINNMRYSMESLGLNVGQITQDYFNHKLLWYQNKQAPIYTSVVSCLLTNNPDENLILSLI